MRLAFVKFITLYLALVATSTAIIAIALETDFWPAVGTALLGCLFKTLVAHAHGHVWNRQQQAAPAYDVELIALPLCECREAA